VSFPIQPTSDGTGGSGQVHITDLSFFTPPVVTVLFAREDANGFDGPSLTTVTAVALCAP
jgi:hypothetical protein